MDADAKRYYVRVIYRVSMCHLVSATDPELACAAASAAEIVGPVEVLEEVDHVVLAELQDAAPAGPGPSCPPSHRLTPGSAGA